MKNHPKNHPMMWRVLSLGVALFAALSLTFAPVFAEEDDCSDLPTFAELQGALKAVVTAGGNGALNNDMWATAVNRDGVVCAVAFSGTDRGDQWPGSRVISAQKANTANAFSLPVGSVGTFSGLALSTANLYAATQPGGSLFGLQHSNPVATDVAYGGLAEDYGTGSSTDPMVGKKIGGVNVFGGGLGWYDDAGYIVGAGGCSGSTSCTDHIVCWKLRDALGLDRVPVGVSPTGDDNIVFDNVGRRDHFRSAGGFGHVECGFGETEIAENLPCTNPIGDVAPGDPDFCPLGVDDDDDDDDD